MYSRLEALFYANNHNNEKQLQMNIYFRIKHSSCYLSCMSPPVPNIFVFNHTAESEWC